LGKLERTYPFLSMRLPRRMWPTPYFKAAKQNTRKLISHFDTYKTLKHFFYMNKHKKLLEGPFDSQSKKCRRYFSESDYKTRSMRGVSLFENVQPTRSCYDAMVPFVYCNCNHQVDLTRNETQFVQHSRLEFKQAAAMIIDRLNTIAESHRNACTPFEYKSIKSVKRLGMNKDFIYKFSFITEPAKAEFQSSIKIVNQTSIELVGKIVRTSVYGKQSDCVKDPKLHGFCYCRKQASS
jgi:hypothetical protein